LLRKECGTEVDCKRKTSGTRFNQKKKNNWNCDSGRIEMDLRACVWAESGGRLIRGVFEAKAERILRVKKKLISVICE
jgi:hypothetical protein